MAIATLASPQVLVPGTQVVLSSVQLDATLTTAQTALTNSSALNVVPTHVVVRNPSILFSGATSITVIVDGITVATLATVTLVAGTGGVLIPLSISGTSTANRVLAPGKVLTVTLSVAQGAGTVCQCDVLGYAVTF